MPQWPEGPAPPAHVPQHVTRSAVPPAGCRHLRRGKDWGLPDTRSRGDVTDSGFPLQSPPAYPGQSSWPCRRGRWRRRRSLHGVRRPWRRRTSRPRSVSSVRWDTPRRWRTPRGSTRACGRPTPLRTHNRETSCGCSRLPPLRAPTPQESWHSSPGFCRLSLRNR